MDRKWWTLIAASAGTFMVLLDITIVNTAVPSIGEDLDADFTDLQWIVDAYTLAVAALVLTAGSLADRFGRRRVFAIGIWIFTVASVLCGMAPDPTFLNLARALQGAGGAIMFAIALALIAEEFPAGRERAAAMGFYGATIAASLAIGPLGGGALTESLGWESIFFVNVPIGAVTLAITWLKLRESRDPDATRTDWAGLVTFSIALFALVLALLRGNEEGWTSTLILSLFAAAALLMGAFVATERRIEQPMLPLHLFRGAAFTGVQLAAFAISGSAFALFLYTTIYLQSFLGHSPFEAGLRFLPIVLTQIIAAMIASTLISRVQSRYLISAGLTLSAVGMFLMSGLELDSEWTALLAGFLVVGLGLGLVNPVIADLAVSVVPKAQSGMASGINDTFRQVGVAVGVAAWGAIFLGRGADKVSTLTEGTPAADGERPRQLIEASSSGNLDAAVAATPAAARDAVADAAREGFLTGINLIFVLGAALAALGALATLALIRESEIERATRALP